jgi:starch synthase
MNLTGLPWELFNWQMLEYYGRLSFLKGGLVAADAITTVSKTYAQEIQTKEFGMGLEGVLRERSHVLVGIVNGVDYSVWNPETDELIAANYSADDLADKAKCKKALQKRFKLPMKKDVPLLGMIGRLIAQKGFDMVAQAAERLMDKGLQIVLLGTGQKEYHEWFTAIAHRFPRRFGLLLGFDEALAHQIEAGSDMFLMPSRFEPCGLNQIYSLKYGTVPIVSRTGGLADTITDCGSQAAGGSAATGFCFDSGDAEKMLAAVDRALDLYRKAPEAWRALQLNGMRQDWSWERSARQYVEVYRKALQSAGKR